jgi:signal transduction histidine kinase
MSYLLHPPLLDELGLLSALRMYVSGYASRTGIRVRLLAPARWKRLPAEIEMNLFRIVQESLSNVYRHSGTATARIALTRAKGHVVLEIRDRGRGLPAGLLDGTTPADSCLGVGILGMQERARQMAGSLEISSAKGGTTVRVTVPLEP